REPVAPILEGARAALAAAGFGPIDYVALVDAATLEPIETLDREVRLAAAATLGSTRLIDNIAV
ncbi:MAG: pantoate--beta-alanine ligase, partial [Pseudomonadota bacterium]|nr:pantoate--beta-alanine ligase [Pseudomonadota bacterium]